MILALAILATLSFALGVWHWIVARRFPLHQRIENLNFAPPISLLKPLKGADETTAESLRSWFAQNYSGATQILFGVASENDPACENVRALLKEFPNHDAQLVVCDASLGTNSKVSKLIGLAKLARHELLLVSDADVRVTPDFLSNIVAPLQNPQVGLVNCFYELANPTTVAMKWEAVAINADFWPQVLQSQSIKPLDFALGAVMLTRRKALEEIGGFEAIVHCLADDYQLGNRIAARGHKIELASVTVQCWEKPATWHGVWNHQLRWARTIRVCQPLPYFFSIVSNATLWPMLWVAAMALKTGASWHLIFPAFFLFARIICARDCMKRLTQRAPIILEAWLILLKDLLQVGIWMAAFAGNTIEWRGQHMVLRGDGTLASKLP